MIYLWYLQTRNSRTAACCTKCLTF